MMTKRCLRCRESKASDEFGIQLRSPDGLQANCRSCECLRMQRRRHGLIASEKAAIADAQGGCAICQRPEPGAKGWVVDHDRSCCAGDVSCEKCRRGVLCQWCNSMLGYSLDNPETLTRAAEYLTSGRRLAAIARARAERMAS